MSNVVSLKDHRPATVTTTGKSAQGQLVNFHVEITKTDPTPLERAMEDDRVRQQLCTAMRVAYFRFGNQEMEGPGALIDRLMAKTRRYSGEEL